MGFDNECIVNIQSLAGEYFCPVCHLLVNPNEAIQSQCTHLYCKPCLSYIANGTRACPYDGYLVTEADSKLLTESNKVLAETIGQVPVHCLYHRSGCTWQGPLSECLNHCPGCAFGNSPVMCNRCGIQIVHRQVQEHAQSCPGVQPQTQAAEGSQLASVASIADQSLTIKNAGTSISQPPISQTVTPGPVSNQQITTSAQLPGAGQSIVPTSEQWYQQQQQQYQQYYQQFVGYDPYQQQYQQYYPYQVHQPQMFVQPLVPSQSQAQPQSQVQSQPEASVQGQPPGQQQLPLQLQPHAPAVAAAPPPNTPVQSTIPPPTQLPSQVQSSQSVPFPLSQTASKPVQYTNQPFIQAQPQVPPNQQSQAQIPQPAVQPVINSSLQRQPNALPQMPSQTQPVAAVPHLPLQSNQQVMAQTQAQYPVAQAVTGYHPYPQPQPLLAPSGAPQPQPMPVNPNTQPHLPQNQGQFPQPSPQLRPFQSLVAVSSQQQSRMLPSPAQLPGIPPVQQQFLHLRSQPPGNPVPQRGVMHQYPQHISQQFSLPQQPSFGGQSASVQNSQPSFHQQLPMQSQLHPPGPRSFPAQMQHGAYPQLQPNAATSLNLRAPHQSANLMGRPTLPTLGPPLKFPQMAGPASSQVMVPGFNQNNIVNSRGELHPPSEQQPVKTLYSKPENNASGQRVDLLSNATIGRDAASFSGADSSLSKMVKSETETRSKHLTDGYKGMSQAGESKQSDAFVYENRESASANESKDIAKQVAAHESTDSDRLDGRLGKVVDEKDVPVILKKVEGKSIQEDKKLIDGPSPLQEDEKLGVHMVSSLNDSGNETKGIYLSGQEEKKLAHAQALVNSFGHGMGRERGEGVLHPSQPDLPIDHGRNRNLLLHNVPSSMPSSIHPHPVGPSHQPHLSGLSISHHGTPGFENSLPGQAQKMTHGNSFGVMHLHHSAPSEMVGRPFFPGTDIIRGHKYPNSALEAEKYFNPRLGYMDGGTNDSHFLGNMEPGVFGQPSDIHSSRSRVTGPPGVDPLLESIPGDRSDWSYAEPPHHGFDRTVNQEDRRKFREPHHDADAVVKFGHFHSGSPFSRGLAQKSFDGHNPDGPGAIAASSRNYHSYGRTADVGERPFGHPDNYIQRLSSFRMPVQHLEPVPGQNRRNMDGLPGRSPGREYPVIPRHAFGDLPGLPPKNLGPELDGRDPYTSFPEPRFPGLHSPFQKEFVEIRNLRMAEFVRNGDQIPHNLMHSDLRRVQVDSRHFRLGEPVSLGSSRDRAGELSGPESFRMGRLNHPQYLPGFRSSFSLHGFPNDGKYPGHPKSFDNPRKRDAGSMGWCRICMVDCETVEGLDMHSQTREHQKAAIDIVRSIKQQNAKRQKLSSTYQAPEEDAGKLKTASADGRGNKP